MIAELANHVWQSTVFAAAVAVLAVVVRRNHARVRYWLWCAASVKFLIPFALLTALGSQADWSPVTETQLPPAVAAVVTQIHQPFSDVTPVMSTTPSSAPRGGGEGMWRAVVIVIWGAGAAAVLLMRLRLWRHVRRLVRTSVPAALVGVDVPADVQVRATPDMHEPAIVGIIRPVLLLPAGIQEYLTPRQLRAVIAHEICHARHRDNLAATVHMLVESAFWFHPLVWWIGRQLVDARERACDEDVLRQLGDPDAYAEGILRVCRRYVEASLVCVSGISGADLKTRVEAIVANQIGSRLRAPRACALIVAGVAAISVPLTVGAVAASQIAAPSLPTLLQDIALRAPVLLPPAVPAAPAAPAAPAVTVPETPTPTAMAVPEMPVMQKTTVAPQPQQPPTPRAAATIAISALSLANRSFSSSRGAADPGLERRFLEAFKGGSPSDRLFVTLNASYQQMNSAEYRVPVTIRIAPGRELNGGRREPMRLDFIGIVADSYGTTHHQLRDHFELAIDDAAFDALATTPLVYDAAFILLPGRYRIQFLVRDQATDRIGAIEVPFFVPNLNRVKPLP